MDCDVQLAAQLYKQDDI